MGMAHSGLAKLVEECGEVGQIAGKLLARPSGVPYPGHDSGRDLKRWLQDELGDLRAAIAFVTVKLGLDSDAVHERSREKMELFLKWDREVDEPYKSPIGQPRNLDGSEFKT